MLIDEFDFWNGQFTCFARGQQWTFCGKRYTPFWDFFIKLSSPLREMAIAHYRKVIVGEQEVAGLRLMPLDAGSRVHAA